MLIRYGCELALVVDRATPTFWRVDIHPERRPDIVAERPFASHAPLPLKQGIDAFGKERDAALLDARN
jgi:hypothetical protein